MTHFFSRLDGILSDVQGDKDIKNSFQQHLKDEIRDGTLFDDYLKKIRTVNSRTLYDILTGEAELPYKKRDIIEDLTGGKYKDADKMQKDKQKFEELLKKVDINILEDKDDKFYLEYLQNYFRFARKIAADEKGGADE